MVKNTRKWAAIFLVIMCVMIIMIGYCSFHRYNTVYAQGKTSAEPSKESKMRNITGGVELKPWQIGLLVASPIVAVIIVFVVMFFKGRSYEEEDVEPSYTPKKSKKVKGSRRLQLALELLDAQKIAREGSLNTDYYFVCIEGTDKGERFYIKKHVSTLGRRSTDGRINDIEISSFEKKVSRSQAKVIFRPEDETFYIVNESDVPIRVNGERVKEAYPLKEGDKIELGGGSVVLLFTRKIYEVEEKV